MSLLIATLDRPHRETRGYHSMRYRSVVIDPPIRCLYRGFDHAKMRNIRYVCLFTHVKSGLNADEDRYLLMEDRVYLRKITALFPINNSYVLFYILYSNFTIIIAIVVSRLVDF